MVSYNKWLPEHDAQLRQLAKQLHLSAHDIGRIMGRSFGSVKHRMIELGIKRRDYRNSRGDECAVLYRRGLSLQEIADHLGYKHVKSVKDLLMDSGVIEAEQEQAGFPYAMYNWEKARKAARERLASL